MLSARRSIWSGAVNRKAVRLKKEVCPANERGVATELPPQPPPRGAHGSTGPTPLAGRGSKYCLCARAFRPRLAVFAESSLDAHASFKMFHKTAGAVEKPMG